ncbi:MAG TPA: phosphoribosyltransferase family protein [Candidatus Saccharimonadales bacterium]
MGMYFKNRQEAGRQLAAELMQYRYDNCIVVALSDGGVQVGEQIASQLHCMLTMLLLEEIEVPGESTMFGNVNQNGGFTYNGAFSAGEIESYYTEFHGYLEEQKREKFQHINRLLGDGGILSNEMLRDHVVILVADGLSSGASLDAVADFLKPIRIQRLVVTTPVASVEAVDRMHILADELHVLGVTDNFMSIDHYYDENDVPSHEETIEKINQIILNWR